MALEGLALFPVVVMREAAGWAGDVGGSLKTLFSGTTDCSRRAASSLLRATSLLNTGVLAWRCSLAFFSACTDQLGLGQRLNGTALTRLQAMALSSRRSPPLI